MSVPWYKRTIRWGQTNITELDVNRYDIDWWRTHWKNTHVQGIIINAGGIVAYYPSEYALHYRSQFLGDQDLLDQVISAAREEVPTDPAVHPDRILEAEEGPGVGSHFPAPDDPAETDRLEVLLDGREEPLEGEAQPHLGVRLHGQPDVSGDVGGRGRDTEQHPEEPRVVAKELLDGVGVVADPGLPALVARERPGELLLGFVDRLLRSRCLGSFCFRWIWKGL